MSDRKYAVLVTGAGSGIGESCVKVLAANGYTVFAGVHQTKPAASGDSPNPQVIPLFLDISCDDSVRAAVRQIEQRGFGLFGVVNAAGISLPGPLEYLEPSDVLALFNVNVVGQLRVVSACLPLLLEQQGRVIMIGSTSGRIPGVFTGAYCASKFALAALSEVLRAELASRHIAVTVIDPGMINTPFWQQTLSRGFALLDQARVTPNPALDGAFAKWLSAVGKSADHGDDPLQVAAQVLRVLTAHRAPFSVVSGLKAKIKLWLWPYLPQACRAWIISRPLRSK